MSRFIEGNPVGLPEKKPKKELPNGVDILVPKGEEQKYLHEHGIEIRNLGNGAMLAGATRRVEDAATADIKVSFPTAPYYEPVGKRGVSHLMEHFIFYPPFYSSQANEADYNATTTPRDIHLTLRGRAHPDVKTYGVWPVLPVAIDTVMQPLSITQESLAIEKRIVIDELHQRTHGLGGAWEDNSLLDRTIFAPGNPLLHRAGGSVAEVESLTVEEVKEYQQNVFIPQGLEAIVFAQGTPDITNALLDQLEDRIGTIPDTGRQPKLLDTSLFGLRNKAYVQGGIYAEDTLKSHQTAGRQQLHYIWELPRNSYTTQESADEQFMNVAFKRLFKNMRDAGVAYHAMPIVIRMSDQTKFFGYTLDIMKQQDPVQYAQQVYTDIGLRAFESFNDQDIADIDRITHLRTASSPIRVETRFEDALSGLRDYGGVIDTDKKLQIENHSTADNFRIAQSEFISTPPTIIVEGDLSK